MFNNAQTFWYHVVNTRVDWEVAHISISEKSPIKRPYGLAAGHNIMIIRLGEAYSDELDRMIKMRWMWMPLFILFYTDSSPRSGGFKSIFSVPLFSKFFRMIKTVVTCTISSWATETPGKCEHDWNYLNYTFAKSKFPITEKLANGVLVTPTPELPTDIKQFMSATSSHGFAHLPTLQWKCYAGLCHKSFWHGWRCNEICCFTFNIYSKYRLLVTWRYAVSVFNGTGFHARWLMVLHLSCDCHFFPITIVYEWTWYSMCFMSRIIKNIFVLYW